MAETLALGSLYLNGKPVSSGVRYNGEQISFGDTVPGMGIPFVKWRGIYVATECVCTYVSWEDLDKHGFIFGQLVKIDGKVYLCRSLKVGAKEETPNEWNAILDDLGEGDDLWHWKNRYFWGQETPSEWPSFRAYRGYISARYWGYTTASARYANFGFRPVLELLSSEPQISDAMIGNTLKLYGNGGSVTGQLVGYSSYDLELSTDGPLPEAFPWIRRLEDTVFVDRDAIMYLCEG